VPLWADGLNYEGGSAYRRFMRHLRVGNKFPGAEGKEEGKSSAELSDEGGISHDGGVKASKRVEKKSGARSRF